MRGSSVRWYTVPLPAAVGREAFVDFARFQRLNGRALASKDPRFGWFDATKFK
jgi:hypothetical protein